MVRYWSLSKFAHFLQRKFAIEKPKAATREDWRKWKKECKAKNKFIFWLTEECFDSVQNFVMYPFKKLSDLRYAVRARFYSRHYMMDTKLDRWKYHEVDTRMLHGLFETLVDFIEIEKAWMMVWCAKDEKEIKELGFKWYESNWWTNWMFEKRHPEAGLKHLEWEMNLKNDDSYFGHHKESIEEAKAKGIYGEMTHQAKAAKEQFDLYNWWKNERPKRLDPYDESGWNAYWQKKEALAKEKNAEFDELDILEEAANSDELKEERQLTFRKIHEIEEAYEKEDEEMMIRLIKLRRSLWT